MESLLLSSLASDLWVAITGSLTLAVFSAIFAALGYGVHEVRKVSNLIHELRLEHEALRRDMDEQVALRGLEEMDPTEPPIERNTTENHRSGYEEHGGP